MGSSPLEYPSFSSEASAERDALFQPVGWMMGKSEREKFNTQTKKRDKRREVRSIFITKLHVKSSEIRCLSSIVKYRKMTWMDQIFAKATQISCVEGNPLPPQKMWSIRLWKIYLFRYKNHTHSSKSHREDHQTERKGGPVIRKQISVTCICYKAALTPSAKK